MKKLALALVCLVSVAFFASCNDITNPEPSIAVMTGENYVYDGQTIDLDATYQVGFRAASNSQTMKDLAKFNLVTKAFDLEGNEVYANDSTINISGTEYVYEETFGFTRELVGTVTFTATVTDVDGQLKSAVVNLNLNQAAQMLEVTDITWVRRGSDSQNAEEMAACGLKWVARDPYHANIQPLNENCKLYVVLNNVEAYNAVTTDVEKIAFFAEQIETNTPVTEYRNISTAQDGDYNDILAVIDASGQQHLILFEKADVETGNFGTMTTIYGKVK